MRLWPRPEESMNATMQARAELASLRSPEFRPYSIIVKNDRKWHRAHVDPAYDLVVVILSISLDC